MHEDYTLLMSLVLDHEATTDEEDLLYEHLEGCPDCARTWSQWRSNDELFRHEPPLIPPDTLLAGVMGAIERSVRKPANPWWYASGLLLLWSVLAASLVTAVLVCALWGVEHPQQISSAVTSAAQVLGALVLLSRQFASILRAAGESAVALAVTGYVGLTLGLGLICLRVIKVSKPRAIAYEGQG
jgi:anti-sigma factor RsiW